MKKEEFEKIAERCAQLEANRDKSFEEAAELYVLERFLGEESAVDSPFDAERHFSNAVECAAALAKIDESHVLTHAKAMAKLAAFYADRADLFYDKAIESYHSALAIAQNIADEDSRTMMIAEIEFGMGRMYSDRGGVPVTEYFQRAFDACDSLVKKGVKLEDDALKVVMLCSTLLQTVYEEAGDHAAARDIRMRSRKFLL